MVVTRKSSSLHFVKTTNLVLSLTRVIATGVGNPSTDTLGSITEHLNAESFTKNSERALDPLRTGLETRVALSFGDDALSPGDPACTVKDTVKSRL